MAGKIRFPMISDESTHAINNHSKGVDEAGSRERNETAEPEIDWSESSANGAGSRYTGHKAV